MLRLVKHLIIWIPASLLLLINYLLLAEEVNSLIACFIIFCGLLMEFNWKDSLLVRPAGIDLHRLKNVCKFCGTVKNARSICPQCGGK